jgi:hypothetical protein
MNNTNTNVNDINSLIAKFDKPVHANDAGIVIIGYHNDADGWASAACVLDRYNADHASGYVSILQFPLQNGDGNLWRADLFLEAVAANTAAYLATRVTVYLLDTCLSTDQMRTLTELAELGVDVHWIDHHVLRASMHEVIDTCVKVFRTCDTHKTNTSGIEYGLAARYGNCLKTWVFFHRLCSPAHICEYADPDSVLGAIARRDVGEYEVGGNVDAITSALFVSYNGYAYQTDPHDLGELYRYCGEIIYGSDEESKTVRDLIRTGSILCRERATRMSRDLGGAFMLRYNGDNGWFKCSACFTTGDLITATATKLATDDNCVAASIVVTGTTISVNFRSVVADNDNETFSALDAATMLGGGGHKNAAQARISFNSLRHVSGVSNSMPLFEILPKRSRSHSSSDSDFDSSCVSGNK